MECDFETVMSILGVLGYHIIISFSPHLSLSLSNDFVDSRLNLACFPSLNFVSFPNLADELKRIFHLDIPRFSHSQKS